MKDVRRIGPEAGSEVFANVCPRELRQIVLQLRLRVAPSEVGIRLREAQLRQPLHDTRPREGLREEYNLGIDRFDFADGPFPKGQSLGVGIIDAENADALVNPIVENAFELTPEPAPVLRVEVKRVDVLVLLRRILSVLD